MREKKAYQEGTEEKKQVETSMGKKRKMKRMGKK